jgi:hypothetical protein
MSLREGLRPKVASPTKQSRFSYKVPDRYSMMDNGLLRFACGFTRNDKHGSAGLDRHVQSVRVREMALPHSLWVLTTKRTKEHEGLLRFACGFTRNDKHGSAGLNCQVQPMRVREMALPHSLWVLATKPQGARRKTFVCLAVRRDSHIPPAQDCTRGKGDPSFTYRGLNW